MPPWAQRCGFGLAHLAGNAVIQVGPLRVQLQRCVQFELVLELGRRPLLGGGGAGKPSVDGSGGPGPACHIASLGEPDCNDAPETSTGAGTGTGEAAAQSVFDQWRESASGARGESFHGKLLSYG